MQIGIDVGGTFTHAVALDPADDRILGQVQVKTTHDAGTGVAAGVVQSLRRLMDEAGLTPGQLAFVAFSTTQATNALLEGDTARVGILGLGSGPTSLLAEQQTRLGDLELGPGVVLQTVHVQVDSGAADLEARLEDAARQLKAAGAETVVVSQAFGIDPESLEGKAVAVLEAAGLQATAASALSKLHGLSSRTRTAVLNASILPVMMRTAHQTELSVQELGIDVPVLVMRSDGGVMGLDEMKRRPIQTILSGPAAGVAAAVIHARVSDGIFLEVGGTSTDISVIRNGRARVAGARVGGHRLSVRTLDITTVGIGGGSVPQLNGGRIVDVGPRSAHIAGYEYACYSSAGRMSRLARGPATGQLRLDALGEAPAVTVTPTCAANLLGRYDVADWGKGDPLAVEAALRKLDQDPIEAARRIESLAGAKVAEVVDRLIREHRLDRETLCLIGGGGGAQAVVPAVASRLGLPCRIVDRAPVISAIGTAIAMLRECVERTVVTPGEAELLAIRREAREAITASGARADSIQVEVEVDTSRSVLRATATGSTVTDPVPVPVDELEAHLPTLFPQGCETPKPIASTTAFQVYQAPRQRRWLLGLMTRQETHLRVLDRGGVVRLQKANASCLSLPARKIPGGLPAFLAGLADYGDSGREAPEVQLLHGSRLLDLSGIAREEQIAALVTAELAGTPEEEPVVVIASPRG